MRPHVSPNDPNPRQTDDPQSEFARSRAASDSQAGEAQTENAADTRTPAQIAHAESISRIREAARNGDAIELRREERDLLNASPEELAGVVEEAFAGRDFHVVNALIDVVGFQRIHAAIPDFLTLALLSDSDAGDPLLIDLLLRRGGLAWRAGPRKSAQTSPEMANALLFAQKTTGEGAAIRQLADDAGLDLDRQRATAAIVGAHESRLAVGVDLGDGETQDFVRCLLNYGDVILDVTFAVTLAGLSPVEVSNVLHNKLIERSRKDSPDHSRDLDIGPDGAIRGKAEGDVMRAIAADAGRRREATQHARQRAKLSVDGAARHASAAKHAEAVAEQGQRHRLLNTGPKLRDAAKGVLAPQAPANATQPAPLAAGNAAPSAAAREPRFTNYSRPLLIDVGDAMRSARQADPRANATLAAFFAPAQLVAMFGTGFAMQAMFGSGSNSSAQTTPLGSGMSPLHIAAMAGNSDAVRWLLESGADAGAMDSMGRTAADIAAAMGFEDLTETIAGAIDRPLFLEQLALQDLEREDRVAAKHAKAAERHEPAHRERDPDPLAMAAAAANENRPMTFRP
ncbi:ankyrin repeat protein [Paraburkholderia fungorum]|jgi:hypothetical protein|nr:ankyrin repeat protein [Paraburkholderia fungorum]